MPEVQSPSYVKVGSVAIRRDVLNRVTQGEMSIRQFRGELRDLRRVLRRGSDGDVTSFSRRHGIKPTAKGKSLSRLDIFFTVQRMRWEYLLNRLKSMFGIPGPSSSQTEAPAVTNPMATVEDQGPEVIQDAEAILRRDPFEMETAQVRAVMDQKRTATEERIAEIDRRLKSFPGQIERLGIQDDPQITGMISYMQDQLEILPSEKQALEATLEITDEIMMAAQFANNQARNALDESEYQYFMALSERGLPLIYEDPNPFSLSLLSQDLLSELTDYSILLGQISKFNSRRDNVLKCQATVHRLNQALQSTDDVMAAYVNDFFGQVGLPIDRLFQRTRQILGTVNEGPD